MMAFPHVVLEIQFDKCNAELAWSDYLFILYGNFTGNKTVFLQSLALHLGEIIQCAQGQCDFTLCYL